MTWRPTWVLWGGEKFTNHRRVMGALDLVCFFFSFFVFLFTTVVIFALLVCVTFSIPRPLRWPLNMHYYFWSFSVSFSHILPSCPVHSSVLHAMPVFWCPAFSPALCVFFAPLWHFYCPFVVLTFFLTFFKAVYKPWCNLAVAVQAGRMGWMDKRVVPCGFCSISSWFVGTKGMIPTVSYNPLIRRGMKK